MSYRCNQDYYGERKCTLPAGHQTPVDGYDAHQSIDGFRWAHHEENVGVDDETGEEVWDLWDEPLGAESYWFNGPINGADSSLDYPRE